MLPEALRVEAASHTRSITTRSRTCIPVAHGDVGTNMALHQTVREFEGSSRRTYASAADKSRAYLPRADGLLAHVIALRQFSLSLGRLSYCVADQVGGSGKPLQSLAHDGRCDSPERNSVRRTCRALKRVSCAEEHNHTNLNIWDRLTCLCTNKLSSQGTLVKRQWHVRCLSHARMSLAIALSTGLHGINL